MGELGKRLYVERLGGIRNSCPLYTTISEASGYGGALPLNVGNVQCYAPLCPVGSSEAIGGYVERFGGVRMAIARTGIKPVDPPKPPDPPDPPTPPPPQYSVLGSGTLRTGLWALDADNRNVNTKPGTRVTSAYGTYIFTADLVPIVPDGTKVIRVSANTPVRNLRGTSGFTGGTVDIAIPQGYGAVKRISATRLKGTHPYQTVISHMTFHDINGILLGAGVGILIFDMSHMNIPNFGMQQVIFNITYLG